MAKGLAIMLARLPARASRRRVPALTHDPSSLFQPPEVVGPFRVRRVLASGTLGPRLLVEDDRGRLQVLKLITDITDDAPALASLLDQVRQSLPLHPALLPVTEVGASDEGVYLASPVLNAPSVEGRLRGGRQTLEATLPWLRTVTAGLQAAHDAGVWHGAIHPRDVLVTDDGGVLTGVGVAPVLEHLKLQAPVRVPFTAPERASGRAWDARADQYSLAMLALDALSGRRLIAGTIPAFDRWTLAETPTEDARLHEVFVRALDPDPDKRYPSVEAWLVALAGPGTAGESAALSRFARDGVILAAPTTVGESGRDSREIAVEAVEDHQTDSLSLFPEESGTIHSPVVEMPGGRDMAAGPVGVASDAEQEWLVADVPDESPSPEADVVPLAIHPAPVPSGTQAATGRPEQDWSLDGRGPTDDTSEPARSWEPEPDEGPSRRPWLLAAVMLMLAVVGYGTWRSVQGPPASPQSGRSAQAEAPPMPQAAAPPAPARPASRGAAAPSPPAAAPKAVPQVPARPAGPRTPPTPPAASAASAVSSPVVVPPIAATGRVLIRSSPTGDVRVNGAPRGETPVVLRDLPFGAYAITITRPGFDPVQREVTLLASQPVASLSVDLVRQGTPGPGPGASPAPQPAAPAPPSPSRPAAPAGPAPSPTGPAATGPAPTAPAVTAAQTPTGGIFVTSTPTQARLFVDGQPYGSTPAGIPGLTPGAHTVRVEATGYKPWEGRVAVLAGTRVRVQATLQQEQE